VTRAIFSQRVHHQQDGDYGQAQADNQEQAVQWHRQQYVALM
jgi:hypothetical protein